MKTVFFTIVDDTYYYPSGTHLLINSFRRFHLDIDLIVFRQDMVDKVMQEKGINFYNAKPTFAKLLTDKYDLIVNVDADHLITGRLDEILKGDYDIGGPWNFNDYENSSVENVTNEMYIQGGMIASTNKRFWDIWEEENKKAPTYLRKENDIMNLVIYNQCKDMKLKIFDKDKDYYGCKSLGREPQFRIENDHLMCRGERVYAYHFARGGVFPKNNIPHMPFTDEVRFWLTNVTTYGQSIKITSI